MEIIQAKTAGFCFGVANAVDKSFEILKNNIGNKYILSYGELIHNDNVINKLNSLGMRVIHNVNEIKEYLEHYKANKFPRMLQNIQIIKYKRQKNKKVNDNLVTEENVKKLVIEYKYGKEE